MNITLLDTGVIVSLLDAAQTTHQHCKSVIGGLGGPFITCEPVIAESCYLLRKVRGASEAILSNIAKGVFQIPFDLSTQADRVIKVLKKYKDIEIDLADACLVVLAEEFETGRILTLDSHFLIYRWHSHKRFKMLLSV